MTEQEKPADGELMFAAGILGGSLNQVKRVMLWLISLVEEGEETGG